MFDDADGFEARGKKIYIKKNGGSTVVLIIVVLLIGI